MQHTPIMILGCTSDAGKSFLCAALCRWFARRGERVAPFKAQNMSNNAAVCPDGAEIGRAQYLQAIAARAVPDARMNPILLKPEADTRSQVVVMGRHDPVLSATPWLERRGALWPLVRGALADLGADYERLVIEGAGSPAEPNLMAYDLVNLAVARQAGAACYLVADIDRGGAFAHLLGTWQTLEPADRALIRGFVLNKFRGDPALLLDAREWLQERTGLPTVALVPFRRHILPEEDGFFSYADPGPAEPDPAAQAAPAGRTIRIGLVLYPWAANLDDLDPLARETGVRVLPIREARDLADPAAWDALVLPGSKHSVASLAHLRSTGLADALVLAAARGTTIYGICGGLQILGQRISDPEGLEGGDAPGLGLLDVETQFSPGKITRQTTVAWIGGGELSGYEIHLGRSAAGPRAEAHLARGLGFCQDRITGVYLHGIFANDAYRAAFLGGLGWRGRTQAWHERLERELDRVADLVDESGWARDLEALSEPRPGRPAVPGSPPAGAPPP